MPLLFSKGWSLWPVVAAEPVSTSPCSDDESLYSHDSDSSDSSETTTTTRFSRAAPKPPLSSSMTTTTTRSKLAPVIQEFDAMIQADSRLFSLFNSMWEETSLIPQFKKDPSLRQASSYEEMLVGLDRVIRSAPEWTTTPLIRGGIGVPMASLLYYAMGTPSGHTAFLDPQVNRGLKKILQEWGRYLETPGSIYVLEGWFSEGAVKNIVDVANAPLGTSYTFEEFFECDTSSQQPFFGYKSWDAYFTRRVRNMDTIRPVASPEDDFVIANACESQPFTSATDVKLRDRFWVKEQPYSLHDMLGDADVAASFVGGTVYQGFLSSVSYHRWHAPVSGAVVSTRVIEGMYFSEPIFSAPDTAAGIDVLEHITDAQGYMASVATRAVVLIQADNPVIGLMAFVAVGMAEVSSCDVVVSEGQRIGKGDDLGMFHFGGSSHCLVFRKEAKLTGLPEVGRDGNVPVRGHLAFVVKHDEEDK